MIFEGATLDPRTRDRTREQHRTLQLVFQNPDRSLNPRHSIRRILVAPLRLYEPEMPESARNARIDELLQWVQLPAKLLDRLLLCDEVVSALDVSVQAGVMNLIRSYSRETGAAVVFVTHDLGVVRMISDQIIVMRSGEICEEADTETIFRAPRHPYTVQLLASVPRLDDEVATG
jgi:peptide/nickel transport system ATP-binding protein